jgi:hypothetical protein
MIATDKYTFLSFCLDLIFINRALLGGRFYECFDKTRFVALKSIDYSFYNAMCYIRNRYDTGSYRLNDYDYTNNAYIPDPQKRPYAEITVGLRPTNYTDFFYLLVKLLWWDITGYIQRNPVPCLIIYLIYNYFPLLTIFIYICTACYISYSLFDK